MGLSWNLSAENQYQAGAELQVTVSFIPSETGTYYLLGGLYTRDIEEYISGTYFGVLLPEGASYAVNSTRYMSWWELEADEEKELPCKFTLDRTDIVLGLFLMKMAGDEPSLESDEQVDSITASLSGPAAVDIGALLTMGIAVMITGMLMATTLRD